MTPQDWWSIGARLLGIYFIVEGCLHAAGAVAMIGMGLPDNSNRLTAIATPLLQAFISGGAGWWLVRRTTFGTESTLANSSANNSMLVTGLQLLGILFVVTGAAGIVYALVDAYFITMDWTFRSAQLIAGIVNVAAGALLISAPRRIANKLAELAGQYRDEF